MTHVAMGCDVILLTKQVIAGLSLIAGLTSHGRVIAYQAELQQCSTAEPAWACMSLAMQNPESRSIASSDTSSNATSLVRILLLELTLQAVIQVGFAHARRQRSGGGGAAAWERNRQRHEVHLRRARARAHTRLSYRKRLRQRRSTSR